MRPSTTSCVIRFMAASSSVRASKADLTLSQPDEAVQDKARLKLIRQYLIPRLNQMPTPHEDASHLGHALIRSGRLWLYDQTDVDYPPADGPSRGTTARCVTADMESYRYFCLDVLFDCPNLAKPSECGSLECGDVPVLTRHLTHASRSYRHITSVDSYLGRALPVDTAGLCRRLATESRSSARASSA